MIRETINELKKYTLGKKNTETVEINVLHLNRVIKALEQTRWIPVTERLPEVDEEACSNGVLISLRKTTWNGDNQRVHTTKIAYYDAYAISSDGIYMDTEGWVLENGNALSMDEVIAWMPLPQLYTESEDNR